MDRPPNNRAEVYRAIRGASHRKIRGIEDADLERLLVENKAQSFSDAISQGLEGPCSKVARILNHSRTLYKVRQASFILSYI